MIVHYLDNLRHFVAYTFQPYAWSPNISAALIQFSVVIAVVKVLRKRFEAFVHRLGMRVVEPHVKSLKAHITAELERTK